MAVRSETHPPSLQTKQAPHPAAGHPLTHCPAKHFPPGQVVCASSALHSPASQRWHAGHELAAVALESATQLPSTQRLQASQPKAPVAVRQLPSHLPDRQTPTEQGVPFKASSGPHPLSVHVLHSPHTLVPLCVRSRSHRPVRGLQDRQRAHPVPQLFSHRPCLHVPPLHCAPSVTATHPGVPTGPHTWQGGHWFSREVALWHTPRMHS